MLRAILLACALCLVPAAAQAHSPYFVDFSGPVSYEGNAYKMQGWFGDGIFAADPVSIVMRHPNGGFSATTFPVTQASGFCPHINFCWGFLFDPTGTIPLIVLSLNPEAMIKDPPKLPESGPAYPDYAKPEMAGFEVSINYLMAPIGFIAAVWQMQRVLVVTTPLALLAAGCLYFMRRWRMEKTDGLYRKAIILFMKLVLVSVLLGIALVFAYIALVAANGAAIAAPVILCFAAKYFYKKYRPART
ncbi:MAG: hypothetical protein GC131_06845 [Alphaproteobacteria bacterium]|nr:hypothetical protein [Alphaproteobacteria bacterium]